MDSHQRRSLRREMQRLHTSQTSMDKKKLENKEPTFKLQDSLGILLGIAGMADMPLPLRLACFLGCAVCLSISFGGRTDWPLWRRWLFSLLAVAITSGMSWSAWKKAHEVTTQAQISVTRIAGVFEVKKETGQEGFGVNIYYRNSGTGPTEGAVRKLAILHVPKAPLSDKDIEKDQDEARKMTYSATDAKSVEEIEANSSEKFFTVPDGSDEKMIQMAAQAHEVLNGNKRLYVFVAFKYRDKSLESNKARLTEICRWAEGDFEAWHFCGVNRTTLVDFTQP